MENFTTDTAYYNDSLIYMFGGSDDTTDTDANVTDAFDTDGEANGEFNPENMPGGPGGFGGGRPPHGGPGGFGGGRPGQGGPGGFGGGRPGQGGPGGIGGNQGDGSSDGNFPDFGETDGDSSTSQGGFGGRPGGFGGGRPGQGGPGGFGGGRPGQGGPGGFGGGRPPHGAPGMFDGEVSDATDAETGDTSTDETI